MNGPGRRWLGALSAVAGGALACAGALWWAGLLREPAGGGDPVVSAARLVRSSVVNVESLAIRAGPARSQPVKQTASGIVVSPKGYILTNWHAVDGAALIRVTAPDGRHCAAHAVGADVERDIALLLAPGLRAPAAQFGDSDAVQVGQAVIAVGNPFGIGITVTHGIVSATDRRNLPVEQGRTLPRVIQTDAAMNHGSSGGALATLDGRVIGLCTAILAEGPEGAPLGVGFAIPVNDLVAGVRGWLGRTAPLAPAADAAPFFGFAVAPVPPAVATQLGAPPDRCLIVLRVWPRSPAEAAGLHRGDLILKVDGRPAVSAEALRRALAGRQSGRPLLLTLMRGDGAEEQVRLGGAEP